MNIKTTCIDYTKLLWKNAKLFLLFLQNSGIGTIHSANLSIGQLYHSFYLQSNRTVDFCSRSNAFFPISNYRIMRCFASTCRAVSVIFIERSGKDAVSYLLELTCGLHSQIFGEDQILSQSKRRAFHRKNQWYYRYCIEVLFRTAITAAKEVKQK